MRVNLLGKLNGEPPTVILGVLWPINWHGMVVLVSRYSIRLWSLDVYAWQTSNIVESDLFAFHLRIAFHINMYEYIACYSYVLLLIIVLH